MKNFEKTEDDRFEISPIDKEFIAKLMCTNDIKADKRHSERIEESIQKQVENISNYCKKQRCDEDCPYYSEGDDYDYSPSCRINRPRDWWYIKD